MTRTRIDWLSPEVRAVMKEAGQEICGTCGTKRKIYPLMGRGSRVRVCPVCDGPEDLILECCKEWIE